MTRREDVFRRRVGDFAKDSRYLDILITQLIRLRDGTDPSRGEQSAQDKDRNAFIALQSAGRLVDALAGWAIDHQIGLALRGLEFVPPQPLGTKQHPEYLKALAEVDLHQHEMSGSKNRDGLNPAAARQLLLNLVTANPGAFPNSLRVMLIDALRSLDLGEVQPLVKPNRLGRNIGHTERELQMEAVSFVHYRNALGMAKHKAFSEVAEAFGVSSETIRTWEKRLRKELGSLKMEQEVWFARNAAELHQDRSRRIAEGELISLPDHWDEHYGSLALSEAARKFRAAQRTDGSKA